jgi:hypothetical protein
VCVCVADIFFSEIKSFDDSTIFKPDINFARGWYDSNFIKLNINKTKDVFFSRKSNFLSFVYKLCESQAH